MKRGRIMSDMYLTKVERKTIFTQGLIYVLFTFIISDLTVVGPHVFVVFPWLYVLGVLGVNKFYHPVLTVTLSCITTFMANLFRYNLEIQTLTSTAISTLVVVCGIVTGLCIKDFVLEHRLVKYMSWKKKALNIFLITAITLVTLVAYAYQYGDIVSYIKAKNQIKAFMKDFESIDYAIQDYEYVPRTFDEYVYKLKVEEQDVTLKVKDDVSVVNFTEWVSYLNYKLNSNITQNMDNVISNLNYEFKDNELKPSVIIATITVPSLDGKNNEFVEKVVSNIQNTLKYVDSFGIRVKKCVLVLEKSVQTLDESEFKNITVDYLLQSLTIENLEEN